MPDSDATFELKIRRGLLTNLATSCLFIAVLTTSGYALSTLPGLNFPLLLFAPTILLLLLASANKQLQQLVGNRLSTVFFLLFFMASYFSLLANPSAVNLFVTVKFWLIIFFAHFVCCVVSYDSFRAWFINGLAVLSFISLFIYLLVNAFGIELGLPVVTNINDMPYQVGLFFFVYDNHLFYRNIGPFWEPGIFGTYLAFAAILLVIDEREKRPVVFGLFLVALASTMSTASALFIAMIIALRVMRKAKTLSQRAAINIIAIAILALLFLMQEQLIQALVSVLPALFSKFNASDSVSILERIQSPIVNWQIFLEKPFFGWGLGGALSAYTERIDAAMTSTSLYYLSAFGIFGVGYSLAWAIAIFRQRHLGLSERVLIFAFVVSFLNKEPHYFFTLTYLLLFYLLRLEVAQKKSAKGNNAEETSAESESISRNVYP